ncbi:N-carbamoyl-D-amino-acid hydrolase (plasmid) [Sulfitobacter sp. W027]|uniref:N-carbamoyl-D-amino-acid hydrolase n=1 Tax=Sulfitobacter sp. W027 TaxID=2867025 RepID=UPI0021A85DFC|nr:N-carbamoyl-D-amino-acid hydrolase [Sulfitobacter sp. W027]UWR35344.1 N-carbamoyl-D-amino-acid hydrolase [Sulfitobacter sp. W027]|tara:strand:- start:117 stop:1055 length:939 start_codon:yes stop_codon:yes gene_type:complete
MSRLIKVGGAQLGPIQRDESKSSAVSRMVALLDQAHAEGCGFVVFPELALTTFFPRHYIENSDEFRAFYEQDMPNPHVKPLFEKAAEYGIGFYLGYAEVAREDDETRYFNTSILVDQTGKIVGKYRKVHLPGHAEYDPERTFQHLEKYYFEPGDVGFPVWRTMDGIFGMCLCNDRRWPETYRVMGLQGVEFVALGYNTPATNSQKPEEGPEERLFHSDLSVQAGAYQNATFVAAIAKAGVEDGNHLIGGSIIVHPNGQIMARAETEDDELIVAECDLDDTVFYKKTIFDFARHRRPEHYGRIVDQTGVILPE